MSYSPGGGSGSVNGSTDVATSNIQNDQVLTWSTGPAKWINASLYTTETAVKVNNYTAADKQRVLCNPVTNGGLTVTLPAVPTSGTAHVEVALTNSDGVSTVQVALPNGTNLTTTGLVLAGEIRAYEASVGGAWRMVEGTSLNSLETWLLNQGVFAAAPTAGDSYASANGVAQTFTHTKGYYIEPSGGWAGTTRPTAPQYFELVCSSFSDQPSWVISGDTITSQSGS